MSLKKIYRTRFIKIKYLILFTLFCFILLMPLKNSHAVKSTCDFQHKECFTEAGYPACYQKIDIQKYYQFIDEQKVEMAESIINDENKCVKLTGNEKAFLQDKSGGFVKFGIRGRNVTFWAKREALFAR